jgi:sulfatase maturation enzyme AslB (radical SAM superfamily)
MCNGDSSSLISGVVNTVSESDWDEILTLAENLKYLTLTGGEPMLIKHYYQLLDHLIAKGKEGIDLRVYTNGSVYNPIFVEKLLKFKTTLNLSIDGVGRTAELQRKGTDWNTVKANVDKFLQLPVNIKFHITLTNISIIDVHSLAEYFASIVAQYPDCRFVAHTANAPSHLAIYNLAAPLCKTALHSISQALNVLTNPQFAQLREQLEAHRSLMEKRVNAS